MINLHTGLPGNGKTLYTLCTVEKRRIAENRAVYYHGINDLKLDWTLIDKPEEWYTLPAGAIIVIDECQRLFVPRPNGAPIPKWESQLETHRHNGHDIYLITQDPTLIPAHARKLVNTHRHMMRKFGSKWVTVHQFEGTRDNVAKSRKDSIESQWVDDVSMYGKYKSAEVITQKIRVPLKLWLAGLLPILIIGLAIYFYNKRLAVNEPASAPVPTGTSQRPAGQASGGQVVKRTYDLSAFVPRVEGLPHTAPRYDELTVPVRVPVVVGCVWFEKSKRGHCYTQQGTTVAAPVDFIKQFIDKGMFEDFDRGPSIGAGNGGFDQSKPLTSPPPANAAPVAVEQPSGAATAWNIRPILDAPKIVSVLDTGSPNGQKATNAK